MDCNLKEVLEDFERLMSRRGDRRVFYVVNSFSDSKPQRVLVKNSKNRYVVRESNIKEYRMDGKIHVVEDFREGSKVLKIL